MKVLIIGLLTVNCIVLCLSDESNSTSSTSLTSSTSPRVNAVEINTKSNYATIVIPEQQAQARKTVDNSMLRNTGDSYLAALADSHGGVPPSNNFKKQQINRDQQEFNEPDYPPNGDNYYPQPQNDYNAPTYSMNQVLGKIFCNLKNSEYCKIGCFDLLHKSICYALLRSEVIVSCLQASYHGISSQIYHQVAMKTGEINGCRSQHPILVKFTAGPVFSGQQRSCSTY